jgi:hypothetical protein
MTSIAEPRMGLIKNVDLKNVNGASWVGRSVG